MRSGRYLTLSLLLLAGAARVQDTASDKLTSDLQVFYADLYGKALKDENRLARLIGVISMSRVAGDALTAKLMVQLEDADPLVAQLVWETLHARQASLTPAQRTKWLDASLEISKHGGFPGSTAKPVIAALASRPAEASKTLADFCVRIAEQNDPATPAGAATLDAAKAAIATWQDPKLSQQLISRLASRPKLQPRLARMLVGLPGAPQEQDASKTVWMNFARDLKITPPSEFAAYEGSSTLFNPPEQITNPNDAKWKKELELGQLKVTNFDLAFCVDATGSMETSNAYVTAYVETITRLFRMMSEQARVSAVYYRHEVDPALQMDCCRKVDNRNSFQIKAFPFTTESAVLVKQMLEMKISKNVSGHNAFGAYAAGIATAMNQLPWSPKATKVIICTGDAKATPNSDAGMLALAKQAKQKNFVLLFPVRDTWAADATAAASREATGFLPIVYRDDVKRLTEEKAATNATAEDLFVGSAFEIAAVRTLELSLPADYRDRAKPLLRTLLPVLKAQDAAKVAAASVK